MDNGMKVRLSDIDLETLDWQSMDFQLVAILQAVEACQDSRPNLQLMAISFERGEFEVSDVVNGEVERVTVDYGDVLLYPACDVASELAMTILEHIQDDE